MMSWSLLPSRWIPLDEYSVSSWLVLGLYALAATGWFSRRSSRPARFICVVTLLSLVGHILAVAVLRVDPSRSTGRVPIGPSWFGIGVAILALLLPYLTTVVVGAIAVTILQAIRRTEQRRLLWWAVPAALYVLWIAPWSSLIILD